MLYSTQSQHLDCFRHRGCWNGWLFGPYFSSLLAIIQCSKRQGLCLNLQVSNTHTPYSIEFYGDVSHMLHEGITQCFMGIMPNFMERQIYTIPQFYNFNELYSFWQHGTLWKEKFQKLLLPQFLSQHKETFVVEFYLLAPSKSCLLDFFDILVLTKFLKNNAYGEIP